MVIRKMGRIASSPPVQYGFAVVTAALCTYLWALGLSHYGTWAIAGIVLALFMTGLIGGVRILLVTMALSILAVYVFALCVYPPELRWTEDGGPLSCQAHFHHQDDAGPAQLRKEFEIEELMAGLEDDTTRLIALTAWVSGQWSHSGSSRPSEPDPLTILREAADGSSFRCVEYSVVLAGSAQALGMPARVLGLKTKNADTAVSGAGHVVAEVWLEDLGKWAFADGQYGYIVTRDSVPLNAVEFQEALAGRAAGLELVSGEGRVGWPASAYYLIWISPYLYYFDFGLDQRQFVPPGERRGGALMLIPAGAGELTVFQRQYPLRGYAYTSCPRFFYCEPGR